MNCVVSHKTALKYYRTIRSSNKNAEVFKDIVDIKLSPNYSVHEIKIALECSNLLVDKSNIDLLFARSISKHKITSARLHFTNIKFPKNSFIKIDRNLYMPCPELLFYLLATKLDFANLMEIGYELCGTYSISSSYETGFVGGITPLTTPAKILSYLNKLNNLNKYCIRINHAKNVAAQLLKNSASPLESKLGIMLFSSRKDGGFNIKNFESNNIIKISNDAKKICLQSSIKPDFSNKKHKIAIEYDSSKFHDNVAQNQKDKLRINALTHDG